MQIDKKEKWIDDTAFRQDSQDSFYDDVLTYPEERRNHKWSVSWSDLMMTMFIFFAVMYVYQAGNRQLSFGIGPGKNQLSGDGSNSIINIDTQQEPLEVYDQTRQAIREIMLDQGKDLNLAANDAVRIVLASDLFFNSGQADLKLGARYQLNQIAKALHSNDLVINVVGHTDDLPSRSDPFPTNWELSSKRAVMVARYLIEKRGIDPRRIFVSAHSAYQPVRPNDTRYDRRLNRRVEIILMKNKPFAQ